MSSSYIHDLSPFALKLTDTFGIRWYGLSYLAGFALAYLIIRWLAVKERTPLKPEQVGDYIFWVAIGCVAGGRIGYCLFYQPSLFTTFTWELPFWGVLAVNQGGMASHGGMIGLVLACYLFGRRHSLPAFHLWDLTAFVAPLGIFMGRIANFINGELVGRVCPENYWLAVKFPTDILSWPGYASQKLPSLANVVPQVGVSAETWKYWIQTRMTSGASNANLRSTLDLIVEEIQDGNDKLKFALEPFLSPRYPSQLFAALTEGVFVFLVLALVWRKPQKPGLIVGLFFCVYAIGRVLNEQYRLPDLHVGFQMFGLTRGQWLSVGVFVGGLVCLSFWRRMKTEPLGGWWASSNRKPNA